MKKSIEVCEICESQHCDGVVYVSVKPFLFRGKRLRTCKNQDEIIERDGILKVKWVIGHGNYQYYEVKKEKTS